MGRLERNLDLALINRIDAGIKPKMPTISHRKNPPRAADTYRAAQRNAVLRGDVRQPWPSSATKTEHYYGRRSSYTIKRFDKYEKRPLTYKPNGERECARRARRFVRV